MKMHLVILAGLAIGCALATQSCQDTAGFIQRGDPNESREYYNSHFSQVGGSKTYDRAGSQQQSR
jgi:hypothetical protein